MSPMVFVVVSVCSLLGEVSPSARAAELIGELSRASLESSPIEVGDQMSIDFPKGFGSPAYEALLRMGPNALPEMMDALADSDGDMSDNLLSLVWRASAVEPYVYAESPMADLAERGPAPRTSEEAPSGTLPVVSFAIVLDDKGWSRGAPTQEERKELYFKWWRHRHEFLKRSDVLALIRQATGDGPASYRGYGPAMHRQLARELLAYGIYSIPYCIDAVVEDDNPLVMMLFLKTVYLAPLKKFGLVPEHLEPEDLVAVPPFTPEDLSLHCVLRDGWQWTYAEEVRPIEEAYPRREDKLRVFSRWWKVRKDTYTRFEDLYTAIDTRIERIEAELGQQAARGSVPTAEVLGTREHLPRSKSRNDRDGDVCVNEDEWRMASPRGLLSDLPAYAQHALTPEYERTGADGGDEAASEGGVDEDHAGEAGVGMTFHGLDSSEVGQGLGWGARSGPELVLKHYHALKAAEQGHYESSSFVDIRPVEFSGKAVGGEILFASWSGLLPCVRLTTTQGETPASLVQRLSAAANADGRCWRWGGTAAEGDSLLSSPWTWVLGGTETGFNIPPPPTSLSGRYDPSDDTIQVWFVAPDGECDRIFVGNPCWANAQTLPASALPMCVWYDVSEDLGFEGSSMSFRAVAFKGSVPSAPAIIDLTPTGQEELRAQVDHGGVAPNWTSWCSEEAGVATPVLEQKLKVYAPGNGDFYREGPSYVVAGKVRTDAYAYDEPADKPAYQCLTTDNGANTVGGTFRRFLGLQPGHSYRIKARLNTFTTSASIGAWSFSLHAACDGADGAGLSSQQMSGQAALPDGSQGEGAGRIAQFSSGGAITSREWFEVSTAPSLGDTPERVIGDITLPEDVRSITTWLRVKADCKTELGMDWIAVEDVTISGEGNEP